MAIMRAWAGLGIMVREGRRKGRSKLLLCAARLWLCCAYGSATPARAGVDGATLAPYPHGCHHALGLLHHLA